MVSIAQSLREADLKYFIAFVARFIYSGKTNVKNVLMTKQMFLFLSYATEIEKIKSKFSPTLLESNAPLCYILV